MINNSESSLMLRALRHQPIERTPVWLMRQAGRYLPEYRASRAAAGDFLTLCKTPELACEVTLQPLRRFRLDAAIIFSDILTIPDAMGLGLSFVDGEGPMLANPIRTLEDIERLRAPVADEALCYVMDAVRLVRQDMPSNLPLIGFSGSPWTLACYMIEGSGSKDFKKALTLMYKEPLAMQQLLTTLTAAVEDYLLSQIRAGVNVVMLFDTWGGILSTSNFQQYSCNTMAAVVKRIKKTYPNIPIILFTKGGGQWLLRLAATGADAISLDWTCDMHAARVALGERVALQGHLDPTVLLSSVSCIQKRVLAVLDAYGRGSGHVFNLGHGITPDVPIEHVEALIEAVHTFSPSYHDDD